MIAPERLTIESYVDQATRLATATSTIYVVMGNKRLFDVMPLVEVDDFLRPKERWNWKIERVIWPRNR